MAVALKWVQPLAEKYASGEFPTRAALAEAHQEKRKLLIADMKRTAKLAKTANPADGLDDDEQAIGKVGHEEIKDENSIKLGGKKIGDKRINNEIKIKGKSKTKDESKIKEHVKGQRKIACNTAIKKKPASIAPPIPIKPLITKLPSIPPSMFGIFGM